MNFLLAYKVPTPPDLHIDVHLLSDGSAVFKTVAGFNGLIDYHRGGINAIFAFDGFSLFEAKQEYVDYDYDTAYSVADNPHIKYWIKQQIEWSNN